MGLYDDQEEHDNLVWDKNDEDFDAAQHQLRLKAFCRKVEAFVAHKFGKPATLISPMIFGGFNVLYRVRVQDLSPDVMLTFPKIGSLLRMGEDTYEVAGRPVTLNMTEMIRLANIPRCVLPPNDKTYMTADGWYTALAEMHIAQLIFQHNDLVTSEDDCRNKFGFSEDDWSSQSSKIPPETLSPCPSNSDSFRLWGDDFRAGNILLDDSDEIVALIDWEYTYAGPTQFILDPPWWLLLETAEMWSPDLDDWRQTYGSRLDIWLSAMEKAEANATTPTSNDLPAPLSRYMRESWQTGRFFLSYAARKSWAFDAMYWNFLDERFFGDRDPGVVKDGLWKTRIDLLSDGEREAMEPFIQRKMAESKERCIVEWDEMEARKRFSELLFD
ncbi:hypothetical protein IL306_000333 [Fusarium sp. DS 682]|nr:hypothetical protein IL306_000333 [Fusarium sp. DS 682]